MTLQLPSGLDWLAQVVAGQSFPQGDEDQLNALGNAWNSAALSLHDVLDDFSGAGQSVLDGLSGPTGDQFAGFVNEMTSNLPQLADGAQQVGQLSQDTALQVQYAKYMIILQLIWTAEQIIEWSSTVAGLAAVPVLEMAARIAVRSVLDALARQVARSVAESVAAMAVMDAAVQGLQFLEGNRHTWNTQDTVQSLEMGALTGAIGGLVGGLGHLVVPKLVKGLADSELAHDVMSSDLVRNITESSLVKNVTVPKAVREIGGQVALGAGVGALNSEVADAVFGMGGNAGLGAAAGVVGALVGAGRGRFGAKDVEAAPHLDISRIEVPVFTAPSEHEARGLPGLDGAARQPVPQKGLEIAADESWRGSRAVAAEWFDPRAEQPPEASWSQAREQAPVVQIATEERDVLAESEVGFDPVTQRPFIRLSSETGLIRHEVRRFQAVGQDGEPGPWMREYTVRVELEAGANVTPAQLDEVGAKAVDSVAELNRGYRLPGGDLLRLKVEVAPAGQDRQPGDPVVHTRVRVTEDDLQPMTQTRWHVDAPAEQIGHELMHSFLPDDYADPAVALHRGLDPVPEDSLMGSGVGPGARLLPRHAWIVDHITRVQAGHPEDLSHGLLSRAEPPVFDHRQDALLATRRGGLKDAVADAELAGRAADVGAAPAGPIDAAKLREAVGSALTARQREALDSVLSDNLVLANFAKVHQGWQVKLPAKDDGGEGERGDGAERSGDVEITVRLKRLGAATDAEVRTQDVNRGEFAGASQADGGESGIASAPGLPSMLAEHVYIPAPVVTVKGGVKGAENNASTGRRFSHSRQGSNSLTELGALTDVSTHDALFTVTVSQPKSSRLSTAWDDTPGQHETESEVELPVRLAWPRTAAPVAASALHLSYPVARPGTPVGERAAQYAEVSKDVAAIEGASLASADDVDRFRQGVAALAGEHAAELVAAFGGLGKDGAQLLFGGQSLNMDFGTGKSAVSARIFLRLTRTEDAAAPGLPDILDLGTSNQKSTTFDHEQTSFQKAETKNTQIGLSMSVSGDVAVVTGAGVEAALAHANTDLHSTVTQISRDVSDSNTGPHRALQAHVDLTVEVRKGGGEPKTADIRNLRLAFTMRDRSDSPKAGQTFELPRHAQVERVPDSVHALYEIDEGTAENFVGPLLAKLRTEHLRPESGLFEGTRDIDFEQLKKDLVKALRGDPRSLLDTEGGVRGDGLRFPLADGKHTVVVRGRVDRAQGTPAKVLSAHERREVLTKSGTEAIRQQRQQNWSLGLKAGGDAAVVSVDATLGYSNRHDASTGYTLSWREQQIWHSSATWHRYQYPIHLDAELESGDGPAQPLFSGDGEDAPLDLTAFISVPEPPHNLAHDARSDFQHETEWTPRQAAPEPKRIGLPARFEVETLKPVRTLRSTAERMLADAAPPETLLNSHPRENVRTMTGEPLARWAGEIDRMAGLAKAAGAGRFAYRLSFGRDFKSPLPHTLEGSAELRTVLSNPRVVGRDDAHEFTRVREASTDLESQERTSRGGELEASVKPTEGVKVLIEAGASATASAGATHETRRDEARNVTEQTTQTYRGRAYLIRYDTTHVLSTELSADHAEGTAVHMSKQVPDGIEVWVDARDIHDVPLSGDQAGKLDPADLARLGGPPAEPTRVEPAPPPVQGTALGTFELHRGDTLRELVDHVDTQLKAWQVERLKGKDAALVQRFDGLREELEAQLTRQVDSGGLSPMLEDALNGGYALVVADEHATNGKRELLVVLHAELAGGRFHDSFEQLDTSNSTTITRDQRSATSTVLHAGAQAGVQGSSSQAVDALHAAAPPVSDFFHKVGEQIGKSLETAPKLVGKAVEGLWDKSTGKLDDTIGDMIAPNVSVELSRTTETVQGDGATSTVRMSRSGPAHQFVYDLKVRLDVHPWARPGTYRNAAGRFMDAVGKAAEQATHALGGHEAASSSSGAVRERGSVVRDLWPSPESTLDSAVRLTMHQEEHQAALITDWTPAEGTPPGTLRDRAVWHGLPEDAYLAVRPFAAPRLRQELRTLISGERSEDRLNSSRSANLLTAASAARLRHHVPDALGEYGYRVDVGGKTLDSVTIKLDIGELDVRGSFRSGGAEHEATQISHDASGTTWGFEAAAKSSADRSVIAYHGEHANEAAGAGGASREQQQPRAAARPQDTAGARYFLVRGTVHTSATPVFTAGHLKELKQQGRQPQPPAESFTADGPIWLTVDEAGLRALGLAVPPVGPEITVAPLVVAAPVAVPGIVVVPDTPPAGSPAPSAFLAVPAPLLDLETILTPEGSLTVLREHAPPATRSGD